MNDPVLGLLKPDPDLPGCLLAFIPFQGRELELRVDPDDGQMDEALEVARGLVTALNELEPKARSVAADELLDDYNGNWREFFRARADGSMEAVSDPALTAAEFAQRISLEALAVTGPTIKFCFSDQGMFAGHSIFVTSVDGTAFTDTHAALFG